MTSIITKDFGITNAENFESSITTGSSNFYVMIGRTIGWANTSNANLFDDVTIETPYDNIQYKNGVLKDGIIIKKINNSDVQAVAPRVDWTSGSVYVAYDQTANLFVKFTDAVVTGGNVNVTGALANTIVANGINLAISTPSLLAGDIVKIANETKEVVRINTAGDFIQVNTNFANTYTSNNLFKVTYSPVQYSNKFYVRNTADQIFKCLFNSNNAVSTVMPEITIGGQLPENPYIETADGYKWKYMYTIPSGLKNKFFNDKYMPVIRDTTVVNNAENGRIDIVEILNAGSGYYENSSVNNYSVVSVTGDGSGATFTVDVLNGEIVEVNIVDGGLNYSTANISITDPLKNGGNTAVLRAVISPEGGHGSDPVRELGASDEMISVDLQGNLNGVLPTKTDGSDDFRQICIVKNPKLANGASAVASIYPLYTLIYTDNPPISLEFSKDTIVYVGDSYANSSFSATVIHFDNVDNVLYVINPVGNTSSIAGKILYEKDNTSVYAQVFSVVPPGINILSADLLYIENRAKIVRSPNQTETVKVVVEF